MHYTILDCYTDEPSGLGVPPYLGTYPRYIYGHLTLQGHSVDYVTVDDLRKYHGLAKESLKTDIKTKNLSTNFPGLKEIIAKTNHLVIVCGVHTPGKYLTGVPATIKEATELSQIFPCQKTITGPAAYGSGQYGGRRASTPQGQNVVPDLLQDTDYSIIAKAAIEGARVAQFFPKGLIAEIETARGCPRAAGCSFCMEPIKNRFLFRKKEDIVEEVKALKSQGVENFRLGKQSDFFAWNTSDMEYILKNCAKYAKVLHIDNVNPVNVTEEKVKLVCKYCTSGNVAAFGAESFDEKVCKANSLNCTPNVVMEAIRVINKHGAKRGENGMPIFLPGLNIIFGLKEESKETHQKNMAFLQSVLDENLLLRRINIREVVIFPGTDMEKVGTKYLRKNKALYWKWRNEIRQKIDYPLLQKLVPIGTILKECILEVHDGNTTFARQVGTYPLIVGVSGRLPLGEKIDVRVTGHMLRSVVGEKV